MSMDSFDDAQLVLTKPANDRTCYFLVFPGSIVQDPPSLPSAENAESLPSSVPDSTPSSPSPKFASLFTYVTPVEKTERPGIFTTKNVGHGQFITELMGRVVVKPDINSQYFGSSVDSTAPSFAPFVFSHHSIPLLIDSRQYGNTSRFVRRGCKGNTRVSTVYASSEQDYKLGVFAEKEIPEESEVILSYNATDINDLSSIDYESMMEGCSDTSNDDSSIKTSCIMFECASCLLVNYEQCRLFQSLSTNPHVKVVPVTSQLPPTPPESTVRRTKVKRRKDSTTEKKKKKPIAEGTETVRRKPGPKPKGRTKPGPKPGRGRRSRVSSPRASEDPATQYFDYEGDSDIEMENGDPNATDSDQRDEEDKERQDIDPNNGNHERKKRRDRSWSQQPAMSREERKIQEQLALMARMENSGERGSRRKPGPKPKSHNLNRKATSEPSSPTSRNLTNYNSENEDGSDNGKVYYSSPNQSDEEDSRMKSSEDSLSSSSSESATDDSEHEFHKNSKDTPNIRQSGSQRTKSILTSRTIISTKTCVIRTCPLKVVFGPPQHYYMNGVTVFGGGKKIWKRLYEEEKLRNLMEVDDVSQFSQNPSLQEKNGFISSPDDDETKIDVEKLEVETPSGSDEIDPVTISKETSPIDTVLANSEDVRMDDVVNVVDDAEEISVDDVQKEPIIDVVHDENDGNAADVHMDDSTLFTARKEESVDVISVEPSINVADSNEQQVSAASPDVSKPVDSVDSIEVLPHSDSNQQPDTTSADTKSESTQSVPPPKPKTKLTLKDYKRKMATRSDSRPELDDSTSSLPVITPVDTPSSFCVERDAEADQVVLSVSSTVEKTDEAVPKETTPPDVTEKNEVEVKKEIVESVQTQPENSSMSSSTMELFPVNNDSQFELFPVDDSNSTMDLFPVQDSPELKSAQTKLKFSLNPARSEMSKVEPKKRSPLAEKEPSETEQNEPPLERRKSLSSSRSSSPKYTTTTPPLPSTAPPSSQTHYPPSTYNSYPQPSSYSKYNSYRPHHSHSVRSFPSRYGQYSYRPDYSSSQGPPSTSSSSQYEPPIPSSTDAKPSSSYYNSRYGSGSSRSDTYTSSSASRGGYYSSERDRGYYRDRDRGYEYRDERDRYGSSRDSRDSDYYRDERDKRDPGERRRDDYDSSVSVPSGASSNSNPSTQSSASRYPPPSSSGATGSGGFGGSSYNDVSSWLFVSLMLFVFINFLFRCNMQDYRRRR
ncbi:hypothetical protein BKA69DRAFT_707920 [Paraphysoderma sedebokerense]|nr:hypothetical protein BKA69DRAFT_707920 [Paraphysoderma sedebokerense]